MDVTQTRIHQHLIDSLYGESWNSKHGSLPPESTNNKLLAIKKPSIPSGTLNIEISSECDVCDRQSDIPHSLHQEIYVILY